MVYLLILSVIVCLLFSETFAWSVTISRHAFWLRKKLPDNTKYHTIPHRVLQIHAVLCIILSSLSWVTFCYYCSRSIFNDTTTALDITICAINVVFIQLVICHSCSMVARYSCLLQKYWPFLSLWLIKIIAKYTDISVFIESARYCVLMQKWYAMQARADKHKTLLTSFLDYIPDMVWTKDTEHRFTYTNKPINDVLLLSDIIGDPVGSTSIDIATKLRDKGIRYTFGEICQDSDKIVIACEKSKTFLEYGTVGDSFLALRVIKAPIYDKGVLIGTIGIGRDVTWDWTQHEELEELLVAGRYEEALSLLQVHKRHDFAHT